MNQDLISLVLGDKFNQWKELIWTILFAGGFALLIAARFTGQLESSTVFFPKYPKPLILYTLIGSALGAWYGFENSINSAYSISCMKNSDVLELQYPYKKIKLPINLTEQIPTLASYRGGHSWRLRFYWYGDHFDTVQLGPIELSAARDFATKCGVRNVSQ